MTQQPNVMGSDQTPNSQAPAHAQPGADAPIGAQVGRSLVWMLGTGIFIKALSFIAQIVMGWFLSKNDFGVYALAFAIVGVLAFIREGGARDYLIQQGAARYKELSGPLFWMAMAITGGIVVLIGVLAATLHWAPGLFPPAYRDPRMPAMLLIGAAMMLVSTPNSFTSAKLQIEIRFDVISRVQIFSGFIRYGVMIGLAIAGCGPLSFMIAALAVQVYELLAYRRLVGVNLFAEPAKPHLWRGFLALTAWLAVGFFGNFLVEWGTSAAVGLFRPEAVVGVYYFAFALAVQTVMLLSSNAQFVLLPALTRMRDNPARQAAALLKATRALLLAASGLCLFFAVVSDSVLTIIWHGKWEAAVLPTQIFCIFFPMRMTYGLTLSAMQARGQFRGWAISSVVEAAVLCSAAGIGAWLAPGSEWAALAVGVAMVFTRVWITGIVLGEVGITAGQRIMAQVPAWGLSLLAAAAVWGVDIYAVGFQGWQSVQAWIVSHAHLGSAAAENRWGPVLMECLRAGVLGSLFCLIYGVLIRVLLPGAVAEAVSHAPRRLRGIAARLAFINLQPADTAEQAAVEAAATLRKPPAN